MTTEERKRLNAGLTQSSYDSNRYNGNNGYSHKEIGSNRTLIKGNVYYGYSAAEEAKKKWGS